MKGLDISVGIEFSGIHAHNVIIDIQRIQYTLNSLFIGLKGFKSGIIGIETENLSSARLLSALVSDVEEREAASCFSVFIKCILNIRMPVIRRMKTGIRIRYAFAFGLSAVVCFSDVIMILPAAACVSASRPVRMNEKYNIHYNCIITGMKWNISAYFCTILSFLI